MNIFDFTEAWERVCKVTKWSKQQDAASFLDIKQSAISGAKKRGSFPVEWAKKIADRYNLNVNWLLLGEGPMRPGDHVAAPVENSPPCDTGKEAYLAKAQDPNQAIDDNMGLGQAVELLAKIFGSNNHILMRAIIANLQAFGEAIDNKNKEMQARAEMAQMQMRMDAMEKQMSALLEEISDMKATQGQSCSEQQEVVNGH